MLSNGNELATGARQQQQLPQQSQQQSQQQLQQQSQQQPAISTGTARSKDDAMVAYLFQRPQAETEQFTGKRWPIGDDMVMEQARTVSDIEREFHSMSFSDKNEVPNAKKLWQDKESGVADVGEHMFSPGVNPWTPQQENWPTGRLGQPYSREFGLGVHHMRSGFPGNNEQLLSLSPRSSETGVLGVNMAEYVLGGAPVMQDRDPRLLTMKGRYLGNEADKMRGEAVQGDCPQFEGEAKPLQGKDDMQNGVIQPGASLSRSFSGMPVPAAAAGTGPVPGQQGLPLVPFGGFPKLNPGPLSADGMLQIVPQQQQQQQQQPLTQPPVMGSAGMTFDMPPFESIHLDPFHINYSNQIMQSTESPNFGFDCAQQLVQQQQRQQQPVAMMSQQQYAMAAQQQQQQQLGVPAFASAPYIINPPDAYGMQIPGPPVVPQYYSTQPPWGIYLATPVQQQPQPGAPPPQPPAPPVDNSLQQLLRGQNAARPLTPQSQLPVAQPDALAMPSGGLQLHSQGGSAAPGGFQILTPAFYDQSGQFIVGGGRGLGTPMRLVSPAPVLVNTATGQQGYAPASGLFTPVSSGLFNPVNSTPLSLTPQQSGYGGALVGGSSTPSASFGSAGSVSQIGSDLFSGVDYKPRPFGQYYGTVAAAANMSPNNPVGYMTAQSQSLTPPPILTASSSNIPFGAGLGLSSGGRLYSSAPGAENKFRNNTVAVTNGLLVQSLLNPRPPAFMKGMPASKEAVGRSQLLEDFRNNQIPNLQLKDLVGHIVEFSQDQHGSRFIQQKLERATAAEKQIVFSEILASAYGLMTDVFGNYVIQKFFEFGTSEQKQMLAQRIRGHVLQLALQMYGCRIIQKALESVPSELQVEIVKELDGHVQKCVKDQNGNHVVQKCIECVDSAQVQFIIDAFKGQVLNLSTHPYGCRIIQRILEHCTPEQTAPILEELHQHTDRLLMDQYGNYVIQHVLEHGRAEDRSRILAQVKNKVLMLSQHKFASNVMEKCVSHASRTERSALIEEVCSTNDGQNCALHAMMKDQYANYVVQRMIDMADPPQRKQLISKIRPHVAVLRKFTYGKHILAKLEKHYVKNNSDLPPIGVSTNGVL